MKSSFQTILLIIFIAAFVFAVAVFSGIFSSGKGQSSTPQGTVTVWGILSSEVMQPYTTTFNSQGLDYSISYIEKSEATFASELITALADGRQPDLVLVSSEIFSQFRDKLYPIPYAQYSERSYRDASVDGGQIFLAREGALALPLLIDPLVVYYNKDLLARENFVLPPQRWEDIARSVPLFTTRDARGNINTSAIALGEGSNIAHSRDILSALFLQAGNPIVSVDRSSGARSAALDTLGTQEALSFYLSFSDPMSETYSWNRALPSNLQLFLSGRLAFYIGRASELFSIQSQNPNLNFDVIELFQPEGAVRPVTFGSMLGVAMLKTAPNPAAAYLALGAIASDESVDALSKGASLPPAKRSLLLVPQESPYVSVFFKAALNSFSWPDPNPAATEGIFRGMMQAITSGRSDLSTAINEANQTLQSNIR